MDIHDESIADARNVEDCQGELESDDGAEDEMEDEETTYLDSEFQTVEQSLSLMKVAEDTLKTGLAVMTSIADTLCKANDTQPACVVALSSSSLSSSSPSSTIVTSLATDSQIEDHSCDQWVSDISRLSESIESAVTDFGAELYPPLTDEATDSLKRNGQNLILVVESFILLLEKKSKFESDLKVMTDNILHEVRTLSNQSIFNVI